MRILYIGDIVGEPGRKALAEYLPQVKEKYDPACVVVNAENSAHGFGFTEKIAREYFDLGVDCLTSGNHVWDQREMLAFITREKRIIRAANYPEKAPGQGHYVHIIPTGQKILIIHVMGRIFMDPLDCPFRAVDKILMKYPLGGGAHAIFVDIHAETTSEKMALAHYLDGRVTAVVGSHTHIPTADAQIFDGGTGYQTDAGMTGNYNSVIGFDPKIPIHKFTTKTPGKTKMFPAKGAGTLCGVITDVNEKGLCNAIVSLRIGGRLATAP